MKTRHINKKGLALIKRHEGLRLNAYLCPANYLTIGYGHLCLEGDFYLEGKSIKEAIQYRKCIKITKDQAKTLLKEDLGKAEDAVSRLIKVKLTDNQFAALVSFTFNLGSGSLQRSTLRRKLNCGEYEAAAFEFIRWVYAKGKELKGLTKRRCDESSLFKSD